MDSNGVNQNTSEPPPPYTSPNSDKPNGRSDTIEPVPSDQSTIQGIPAPGPNGDAPAPSIAVVPPAGTTTTTTQPVSPPVTQMTPVLPPVSGALPPVNPLIGGDLGDIKLTGIAPPPYLAPPPYESKFILNNPIRNQGHLRYDSYESYGILLAFHCSLALFGSYI